MEVHVLPPTISDVTKHDLEKYIARVGRKVDTPWLINLAQQSSLPEILNRRIFEFCPENGGLEGSIDAVAQSILHIIGPQQQIAVVSQPFITSVYGLSEVKDYSAESWKAFQDFLLTPSNALPNQPQTTMEDAELPSFPDPPDNGGSLIVGTGIVEEHYILNIARKVTDKNTGEFQFEIQDYDTNQYGSSASSEKFYQRQRVLCYIIFFSYLKAMESKHGRKASGFAYPGPDWPTKHFTVYFKGCCFDDGYTICQLGGSCFQHGSYLLMQHILGPGNLLPPMNELQQLMYGGLVTLHLYRTGQICTNYTQLLYRQVDTMREWRKCLKLGTLAKVGKIEQDQIFLKKVITAIVDSCNSTCPAPSLLVQPDELKTFAQDVIFHYIKNPTTTNVQSYHFWITLFCAMTIRRIKAMELSSVDDTIDVVEPGCGILWYASQVFDPINWTNVQNYASTTTTTTTSEQSNSYSSSCTYPMKRISVYPVIKEDDNRWAIVVFALSYDLKGEKMQMTLFLIYFSSTFTVQERRLLLEYIVLEKIRKEIELCEDYLLHDFVVEYVELRKPLEWQHTCDSLRENSITDCRHWIDAANMSVLYVFSKIPYCFYTKQIQHPHNMNNLIRFGCDCLQRLAALENCVSVISEIVPFSFALALKEFCDDN